MTGDPVKIGPEVVPDDDIINACIHCGMCLPVCPTYALTGLERSSPRGRIRLMKEVSEGRLPISDLFIDEMEFCLDCQACETVCPAGIQYGQLAESARERIFVAGKDPNGRIKRLVFRGLFASARRIQGVSRLLRLYQKRGAWLFNKIMPRRLAALQALAPTIPPHFSDELIPEVTSGSGPAKRRVGLLSGCLMSVMYGEVNRDTAAVLLENDCEVVTPRSQGCCGSLPAHNGDREIARRYAKALMDQFEGLDLEAIVVNSAGCGAFMKKYAGLFAGDSEAGSQASAFTAKVRDISEFLVELQPKPPKHPIKARACYHEACHLVHSQGISEAPRTLLQSIPGIEWVELEESTWCCGSAGIYNIVRHEDSLKILNRKMEHIAASGANIVVTANPGCLAQIAFGATQRGMTLEVLHPVTLLSRAYARSPLQL